MIRNILHGSIKSKIDFDIEEIHRTSVRILEEIGIEIKSKKCLDLLNSIGCNVDYSAFKVRIPEPIINKTLLYNNSSHKLYDRNGSYFITFGKNNLSFTSGAFALRIKEFNNKYRDATFSDLEKITRIHDFYDKIDIVQMSVSATDIPQEIFYTKMASTVFKNTKKPCWLIAADPKVVQDIFAMGIAIRGNKEDLIKKPFFRINSISNPVLGFQQNQVETLMKCAELGIPTENEHYPIIGLTAPLSISGALALNNANYLCAQVIKGIINPNNYSIYIIQAGSFNMSNGEVVTSSPEIWLYYLAGIKMGQYYNIPTCVAISTDSKSSDIQMAYEKTMGYLISANAGVNNIVGAGNLDSYNLTSYEQIIIDLEFLSLLSNYLKGFIFETNENDFNIIKRSLNNKMYFLDDVSTINNYKKSLFKYEIFTKDNFSNWKKSGMIKVVDNAHDKVKKILKSHLIQKLPSEVLKEIERIENNALKEKNFFREGVYN